MNHNPSPSAPRQLRRLALTMLLAMHGVAQATEEFVYTVQQGDHPWNIAQRYLKDTSFAKKLARLNSITNDRQVAPGTELRIPAQWLKLIAARVRVLTAHGEAIVLSPQDKLRQAVAGEELLVGSRLQTGSRSSATLEFDDGSRVTLRQASELKLVRSQTRVLDGGFMVELELLRGGLENTVTPKSSPPTRFEIRTPAAVAAVRGTSFRISAGQTTAWTEVLTGAVQVVNTAGDVQAQAGFGTITQAGKAPEPPRPLLPAPQLTDLPGRFERLPINWPLEPVPRAVGYRTQLATDAGFTSVLSDEQTELARARVVDVADGTYVMRVRAIDADGLEGLVSERPVLVFAGPQAPALISPQPGAQLTEPQPVFQWTQAGPGWHYRLELRRSDNLAEAPVFTQTTPNANGTTVQEELTPGQYHWRVASIVPATGRQGPWGDLQSFRRTVPAPDVEPPKIDTEGLAIRWPAVRHATTYDIQVSADGQFSQPLVSTRTEAPQYQMGKLAPGSYQLRVRAQGQDGFAGPWGKPQAFTIPEPPKPEPHPWRALLLLIPALILFGL